MPTFTWDAAFEAVPADADLISAGADVIRDLKTATSEREELEHNFKTGTQPFHKAGKCSVLFLGTTTEINALTGMGGATAGCTLAWDTTLKVLKKYNGSAWSIMDIDHGALSGLTDDDHTRYLSLDKAGQNLVQSITVTAAATIDGRDISVDGAALDAHIAGTALSQHTAGLGTVFGAWATKALTTVYLAATDGFVMGWASFTSSGEGLYGYTDSSNPPTTIRDKSYSESDNTACTVRMPVRKGDYWKVVTIDEAPALSAVYWLPIGV